MYDKQVRRRRLVLAAFVVASLILLTVYFGEGTGGGLHAMQRGALSVLGPIQEGANRALKPVRDLFGWVGDTVDAKKERDALVTKNQDLERQLTALQVQRSENANLKKLLQINQGGLDQYAPLKTLVIARDPSLFYSRVIIDKGRSAGVRTGQPVVNGAGLVGRVSDVTRGNSVVTLLTDETFATGVRVLGTPTQQTTIKASINQPGDLELTIVPSADKVHRGDRVVTDGSASLRLASYYQPNLLIGQVSRIETGDGPLDTRIHVKPAVDLGDLRYVEVLTKAAQPRTVASATTVSNAP